MQLTCINGTGNDLYLPSDSTKLPHCFVISISFSFRSVYLRTEFYCYSYFTCQMCSSIKYPYPPSLEIPRRGEGGVSIAKENGKLNWEV